MIARLRGILAEKQADQLIVDVNGVGYRVMTTLSTFYRLPDSGSEVELIIHTHVGESALDLYGFLTDQEKATFTLLLGVSGIGPKLALGALSGIEAPDLLKALAAGDLHSLTAIPGIGKKTAQRMIVDLKDKAVSLGWSSVRTGPGPSGSGDRTLDDAVSALLNLGYNQAQAEQAVRTAQEETPDNPELAELIKQALKRLAR